MAESDPYFQKYHECEELYEEAKYTECTELALSNLMDSSIPRYFFIKTLILLVGAENDDWDKAEAYRLRAEKEYATIKQLLAKPPTPAEEASMKELRTELDDMLEYQANDAPPMSLQLAHYPGREGNLLDFLYEREVLKDDAEEFERAEVAEELAEELKELELDDDGLQLEDEEAMRAAEAEVVGGDLNATQSLREMRLDGPKASSVKAAENYQDQPEKESNEHD